MARDGQYVVVYDLTDNKERTQVAKILQGFGCRVQKSVFECRLSESMRNRLTAQLENLCLQTGGVRLYRINACASSIAIGQCSASFDEETFAYVL
ncbi:MAG: CRISPR-associated endonuclease Cas2 [Solidesulfovibrio sp.]|uniref:CRISPR-associated endonuclease Cas2 n=1 Tax=Solidesulfovibrio sp. TaxID=2910990 RepID=UPI0031584436